LGQPNPWPTSLGKAERHCGGPPLNPSANPNLIYSIGFKIYWILQATITTKASNSKTIEEKIFTTIKKITPQISSTHKYNNNKSHR
jgi:hypothetical protein